MSNKKNLGFALIIFCFLGCAGNNLKQQGFCLEEAFNHVVQKDNNSILHTKEELLLIANFNNKAKNVRIALIPKEIYPAYLVDKREYPKGQEEFQGITLLGYGDCLKYLKLKPVNDSLSYLKPMKIKDPKPGFPPLPSPRVEPLIYSFGLKVGCFQFEQKTVADTLIN